MQTKLILGGLAAIAVILGEVWLLAAPQAPEQHQSKSPQARIMPGHSSATAAASIALTVGTPNATPSLITVNTPTTVTVTVQINPAPLAGGVNLLRLGATGTQPTILGVMHDDGKNGDAVAGDCIFTLQVPFNEAAAGQIQLEVSAAFPRSLQRVLSNVATVSVWNRFTDTSSQLTFAFPPFSQNMQLASSPGTSTTPPTIDIQAVDPITNDSLTLLEFIVDDNPMHLTLQSWFEQNIDLNGILLGSGAIQQEHLSNGLDAIFVTGPLPSQYVDQAGPVDDAFLMSQSGNNVLIVDQSQDVGLTDLPSYAQMSITSLLPTILSTVTFH